jgi:hypothetical protein
MPTNKETGQTAQTGQTGQTGQTVETGQSVAASATDPYVIRAERARQRQLRQRARTVGLGPTLAERFVSALESAASALKEKGSAFQVTESTQPSSPENTAGQSPAQTSAGQSPAPSDSVGTTGTLVTAQEVASWRRELADVKQQLSNIQTGVNAIGGHITEAVADAMDQVVKDFAWTKREKPMLKNRTHRHADLGPSQKQGAAGRTQRGKGR